MSRVAVIGAGASGLAAAIAAAECGADVTVFEASARAGSPILATGNGRCNLTNTHIARSDTSPDTRDQNVRLAPRSLTDASPPPADSHGAVHSPASASPDALSPDAASAYNAPSFVAPVLAAHDADELREWFGRLGLATVVDTGGIDGGGGRVYPLSHTAKTVVDVLLAACERLGICIRTDCRIESVAIGSQVRSDADAVVVCTGGGSRLLETAGHMLADPTPVLCPLATDTAPIQGLSGVRVRAQVTVLPGRGAGEGGGPLESRESGEPCEGGEGRDPLKGGGTLESRKSARVREGEETREPAVPPKFSEYGEVLFRDYGVSGVVVFDASRYAVAGDVLELDLLPSTDERELADALAERRRRLGPDASAEEVLCGMWHERVCRAILRAAGEDAYADHAYADPAYAKRAAGAAAGGAARDIAHAAKHFRLRVEGPADTRHAQVTRGGASLGEFDPQTMESRLADGLFAAGEALDIDARCGGYNLHWAWASGRTAGEHAARRAAR